MSPGASSGGFLEPSVLADGCAASPLSCGTPYGSPSVAERGLRYAVLKAWTFLTFLSIFVILFQSVGTLCVKNVSLYLFLMHLFSY
jgi:hypothetical protein